MNILFINACVRKNSRTLQLANAVLEKLQTEYGDCSKSGAASCGASRQDSIQSGITVTECRLDQENIQPLNADTLARRDRLIAAKDYSDPMFRYAHQLAAADLVVIAAPFWDMSFPASLKTYIESVMVTGLVFRYGEHGEPVSLCKARKMVYVSTSGGPVLPKHYGFDYVSMIAEFFWGIKDQKLIQAEMLDVDGADVDNILASKIAGIRQSL